MNAAQEYCRIKTIIQMDRKAMVPRSQIIYKDFFTGLISENRRLISDFYFIVEGLGVRAIPR